ncbi:MAG: ATP-binding protein [Dehalococcoidia bacterium]
MVFQEILPVIQACFSSVLLLILLVKAWREPVKRLFAGFLLGVACWGFLYFGMSSDPDPGKALWWERAAVISFSFTWVMYYHFALRFTGILKWSIPLISAYIYLGAVAGLALTDLIVSHIKTEGYGPAPVWGPLFLFFIIPAYLLVLMAGLRLNKARLSAGSYAERNRLTYFVIGTAIVFAGGLADLMFDLRADIYPVTVIAGTILVILSGLAVLTSRLVDVELTVYRLVPYTGMFILVAGVYSGIYFILEYFWEHENTPIWLHMLFALLIVAGVRPTWSWIQQLTSLMFYRGRYRHLRYIDNLRDEGQSIVDPSAATASIPRLVKQAMQSRYACLLQPVHAEGDYRVSASSGIDGEELNISLGKDNPLINLLRTHEGVLHRNDTATGDGPEAFTEHDRNVLERIEATLLVPLNFGDRLVGLLILGPKTGNRPYSWDDERLLARIARTMALIIDNIQVYQASLERESQFEALSRLSRVLNRSLDFESVYELFTDELKKSIPMDRACIVLPEGNELKFFPLSSGMETPPGQGEGRISYEGTACEWVVANKSMLYEPDLAGQSGFADRFYYIGQGIRSVVHLPLISRGEVFGVFSVGSTRPEAYTKRDLVFVEQVAGHLSLTMDNARLYSRERSEWTNLQAMNKQRDEFFNIISHELKTPLTSIKSSSELLVEELGSDERDPLRRLVENIRRSTERMEAMMEDLVDITRSRSAALEVDLRPMDLVPVIKNALQLCISPIESKEQSLEVELPEALPPVIADAECFEHIITNLLVNANKYTPRGGKLSLSVRLEGNKVLIEVRDTGPGIPEEEQDLIFEPYYRGEYTANDIAGTGIGLATVKQMVNLHRGKVWARSREGEGSVFTVSIPVL